MELTPELFDAMFESEEFSARLKQRWQALEAEKAAEEHQRHMARLRSDGTEAMLKEEFFGKPNASASEIATRRRQLHAEFDRRFS